MVQFTLRRQGPSGKEPEKAKESEKGRVIEYEGGKEKVERGKNVCGV